MEILIFYNIVETINDFGGQSQKWHNINAVIKFWLMLQTAATNLRHFQMLFRDYYGAIQRCGVYLRNCDYFGQQQSPRLLFKNEIQQKIEPPPLGVCESE